MTSAAPVDVSVVLCTYNRAAMLVPCLESLLVQQTADFTYEIVVVDDGSTDATPEQVTHLAARDDLPCPLRYVRAGGLGVAAARNRCISAARGAWVAFFDDDQTAEPDWLLGLMRFAREKPALCVGGARDLCLDGGRCGQLPRDLRAVLGEMSPTVPAHRCGLKPLLASGTVLIHREVLDRVGGFDESLLYGGSDLDLFERIRAAGIDCWFNPRSLCHHKIPAHRLAAEYLLWCSLRNGQNFAHRDRRRASRGRVLLTAFLRSGQSLFMFRPRWLLARARGEHWQALAHKCRIVRNRGYLWHALSLCLPAGAWRSRLLSRLSFRQQPRGKQDTVFGSRTSPPAGEVKPAADERCAVRGEQPDSPRTSVPS